MLVIEIFVYLLLGTIAVMLAIILFKVFTDPNYGLERTSVNRRYFHADEPFETTTQAVLQVFAAMKLQGIRVNHRDGVATAKKGRSSLSYGEDIQITVSRASDGGSDLVLQSRSALKTTRFDWGVNKKNVAALAELLARQLALQEIDG